MVSMATGLQSRDASATLCIQRHTNARKQDILPDVEKAEKAAS